MTGLASGERIHATLFRDVRSWPRSLGLLAGLMGMLLVLFHQDVADIVRIWWTSSTYNHCLLIVPMLGWLVWQRREGLALLDPEPWALPLLWLLAGGVTWLLGAMASVALFRHVALIIMAQGLAMATLGPSVSRALAFPLAFALFLIPAGSELEPVLQIATARMAAALLWITGVPASIEGIFITIPNGYFRVAEACSGTAFLITMAAYASLVANICFASPLRRGLFMAGALITCLLANGVRAYGIILFAYHAGVNSAVVVDHIVYGWLFFATVMALVMLAGQRWFDRDPMDDWFTPSLLQGAAQRSDGARWIVGVASVALMLAPIGWVGASRAMSTPLPADITAPHAPGWSRISDPSDFPWRPHFSGADRLMVAHYRNASGQVVDLAIILYAEQAEGKEVVGFGQGAASPDGAGIWTWSAPASAPPGMKGEILAGPGGGFRLALTAYVLGGIETGSATQVKLATLKARLLGRDQRAVAIILSTTQTPDSQGAEQSEATLARFMAALGPIKSLADRSLAIR